MAIVVKNKVTFRNPELYQRTKFGRYLLKKEESAYDFAKYARISVLTIYKILQGKDIRIDVAKRVVRVTKKELKLEDFGYETK